MIWYKLCQNKNAVDLIKQYPEKIDWSEVSLNENAIDLLEENIDKIEWVNLATHNPRAIELLQKYPEILPHHIKLYYLCYNKNPVVIELIQHKIYKNKHRTRFCTNNFENEDEDEDEDEDEYNLRCYTENNCECYYCKLCLDWKSLSENKNAII